MREAANAGLSNREVEVLRPAARGLSNRAAATYFAMQHGLLIPGEYAEKTGRPTPVSSSIPLFTTNQTNGSSLETRRVGQR